MSPIVYQVYWRVPGSRLVNGSLGEVASGGRELGLGQAQGEPDPLVGELPELVVGGDLRPDLGQQRPTDELGGALALVDPAQLVVGAMALRVLGVLAATVGFSTDAVLLGETARSHLPQDDQLGLDLLNPLFEMLNRSGGAHVR